MDEQTSHVGRALAFIVPYFGVSHFRVPHFRVPPFRVSHSQGRPFKKKAMTETLEYRRFGLGCFNSQTAETRQFDAAPQLILADAWLELAKETGQEVSPESREFATRFQRWVSARFK